MAQIVITGSRTERFLAKHFIANVPDTVDLVGKTSIQSVAALMSRPQLFVTQDTGVLHVASACKVPLIGLFGPTNAQATGPYPSRTYQIVIVKDRMTDITPAIVHAAAIELLTERSLQASNPPIALGGSSGTGDSK